MHSIYFCGLFFTHLISRHSYLVYCQCDSHATSQMAIYANITQPGCIKVYCRWFWIVLAGFVGGCRWFWLVACSSNYGHSAHFMSLCVLTFVSRLVKMTGYWPRSLLVFLWTWTSSQLFTGYSTMYS